MGVIYCMGALLTWKMQRELLYNSVKKKKKRKSTILFKWQDELQGNNKLTVDERRNTKG